ncbi:hypothetical protein B0H16DRAFT_1706886, partial [Mycena metata]
MKRKAPKSSPAPSGTALSLSADSPSLVDRSSPAAPWSFLSSYQAFIEIIQFFAKENIKYSDSTVAVPLVNTLRPLLRLRPSSSSASPRNGPSTSSPTFPPCPFKTRTPLSLSKIDLDSESEEEPVVKKPRLDKPPVPGRAASVEGGAAAVSTPPQPAAGPSTTTPCVLRSTAAETPTKPSTTDKSIIKVKAPPKPEPKPAKVETKPEVKLPKVESKPEVKPSKPPPPTVSTAKVKGKEKDPEPYLTAEQK